MNTDSITKRCPFSAQISRDSKLVVFTMNGDLDVLGAQILRNLYADKVEDADKFIVFDMANVPYINSAGLGAIIGFLKNIQLREGSLMILNPQNKVRSVFQISSLEHRMLFFEAIEEAHRIADGGGLPQVTGEG